MSRSDHRVVLKSFESFKPFVRVGVYRVPKRRFIEGERERSLQGREDRGESLDRWLSDSGRVLRILKFTRTLRRDERV